MLNFDNATLPPFFWRHRTLLITSALTCLALSGSVMAQDFVITSGSDTNGQFSATQINGDDTVTLGVALDTQTVHNEGGIETGGDTNTITVLKLGSITTGGDSAHGIYNYGSDNTTTMSGSITTTGQFARGISNYGSDNTTTMSGSITTTGQYANGITNSGSDNTTTVSGSITTSGERAAGISNYGSDNTTTMSGSITTAGYYTRGIKNSGNNNTTTVSGSITTAGQYAIGILNLGNDNATAMSGSITTSGNTAHSISNSGQGQTISISGTVKATGTRSTALYNHAGAGNSFTLNEGALIIGGILATDSSTNSKLIFNLNASNSYAYTVSGLGAGTDGGQWAFSDLDGRSQTVTTTGTGCETNVPGANNTVCNLVTAVGVGNAEVQNELQYINNSSRIESLKLNTPVSTSADGTAANGIWVNTYGVSTKRDAIATGASGFSLDAATYGITVGKPIILDESLDLDLVFNTSKTALGIGANKDQEMTTQSFNFGVVMSDLVPSYNWDLDAFGFVGHTSYDGKRKVMNNQVSTGFETATAEYASTQILVGFDADYTAPMSESVHFKGGINANLSSQMIGAYAESKYATWDARTLSQVATGLTAGLVHEADALTSFVSLGADYSSLLSGQKASFTNNGTATSYTDNNTQDIHSIAAVGFDYEGGNGVLFAGSIKGSSSNKGLSSTIASLSLNSQF